jgi:hopanoid biosynthesis associated radical SAM protein HpnH
MRFPLSLTCSLARYLFEQKLARRERFPLVLMLEPLHACNLSCAGCGRIREYADTLDRRLSIGECLAAADECGAPVVSVCGGEPLIYPGIEELVAKLVARRRHVYLCTNGLLLEKKLAAFRPSGRLFINVHLDGMEATHDRLVERAGAFNAAIAGITAAANAGFQITINTTIYKHTELDEIAVLWQYLTELGAGTFMISPAYAYQAVQDAAPDSAAAIFMCRDEAQEKFRRARAMLSRFRLAASPLYMDFLCGLRELSCAAWANPTRNVRGWRSPCYLIAETHYATYRELIEATDWKRIGPGNDPRCEHCLVHCGFEPAAVLAAGRRMRDMLKMAAWQMGW